MCLVLTDSDAGRLERGIVHRDGEDVAVGCSLFHLSHDVRQLRPLQPARRHPRRGLRRRGRSVGPAYLQKRKCSIFSHYESANKLPRKRNIDCYREPTATTVYETANWTLHDTPASPM